jgi:hypothetical protein
MELYFNPYPGAAHDADSATALVVSLAEALHRLERKLPEQILSGSYADDEKSPSHFVIVRNAGCGEYEIGNIFSNVGGREREYIRQLLSMFSRGRKFELREESGVEDWLLKGIGAAAPILEIAAKNGAMALTIPTEEFWRVDLIEFDARNETLHNLWGQNDVSALVHHCIDSLANARERFSHKYRAEFCDGALNSAPDSRCWERFEFFRSMDKAQERNYVVDRNLLKNVGSTKHGPLLELRCYGHGHRIFFTVKGGGETKLLIGGFYHKSGGLGQSEAIERAVERINRSTL